MSGLRSEQVCPDFKRPARVIADTFDWEQLRRAKLAACRVCGSGWLPTLHHIVPRSQGGDDLPWRDDAARAAVRESLTAAEVAYVAGKVGLEWLDVNYPRLS